MMTTAQAQPTIPTDAPAGSGVSPMDFGLPISGAQRRALFAAGKARGLDIDDLRALTPAGSISLLTRFQAARLIDRLNAGTESAYPKRRSRSPRRPKGVYAIATAAQRNKLEALRIDLDWTPERLHGWLAERHHADGRPMTRIDSTADASAVIELLKAVLAKTERAREHRRDAEARSDCLTQEAIECSQGGLASPLKGGSQT